MWNTDGHSWSTTWSWPGSAPAVDRMFQLTGAGAGEPVAQLRGDARRRAHRGRRGAEVVVDATEVLDTGVVNGWWVLPHPAATAASTTTRPPPPDAHLTPATMQPSGETARAQADLVQPHPRVEHRVQDVDHDVGHDHRGRRATITMPMITGRSCCSMACTAV